MQNTLYKQLIIDNYKSPKNFVGVENKEYVNKVENASCGDVITVGIDVDKKGKIKSVAFDGSGCAISIAAASILLDSVKGKDISEIKKIEAADVLKMVGMEASSGRVKCALLGYEGLKNLIKDIQIADVKKAIKGKIAM